MPLSERLPNVRQVPTFAVGTPRSDDKNRHALMKQTIREEHRLMQMTFLGDAQQDILIAIDEFSADPVKHAVLRHLPIGIRQYHQIIKMHGVFM